MLTDIVKRLMKTIPLIIGLATVQSFAADGAAQDNYQLVDGVAIYLGVVPAQIVRGHPMGHAEAGMHGGMPAGRNSNHVVVALFDAASGKRIEDAQVTASVNELALGPDWKSLEPMRIADTITYGNYFNMPDAVAYRIHLRIRLPGQEQAIKATFTHEHASN